MAGIRGFALLAALLIFAAGAAIAETVVVTPSNYEAKGWKIYTTRGDNPDPSPAQDSIGAFEVCPFAPWGYGAFHMKTSDWAPVPPDLVQLPKVYLGTNEWSNPPPSNPRDGINVKNITALFYSVNLLNRVYTPEIGGSPMGHPPDLVLHCWVANDPINEPDNWEMRIFRYCPWGLDGELHSQLNQWRTYNCMTEGYWIMDYTNSPDYAGDWNWLINRKPIIVLWTPPEGGYPYAPTGCGVNFVVGAGKWSENPWHSGWWRESCGIDGYIDNFGFGYDKPDGTNVEKIYDFEAGDPTPIYALSNKSAADTVIGAARTKARFAAFGRVLDAPAPEANYFFIDDGSGTLVKVNAVGHQVRANEYVRAVGVLNNQMADGEISKAEITCTSLDISWIVP